MELIDKFRKVRECLSNESSYSLFLCTTAEKVGISKEMYKYLCQIDVLHPVLWKKAKDWIQIKYDDFITPEEVLKRGSSFWRPNDRESRLKFLDFIIEDLETFKGYEVGDEVYVSRKFFKSYKLEEYAGKPVRLLSKSRRYGSFMTNIPYSSNNEGFLFMLPSRIKGYAKGTSISDEESKKTIEADKFKEGMYKLGMAVINFMDEENKVRGIDGFTTPLAPNYTSSDLNKDKTAPKSPHKGLRFNNGKKRFDLVHPWAHEQMVNVLTIGSEKYEERNWERGMSWTTVIASLKRHLNAIESGEDYDPETKELHAAHLACNAHFLTAYYKIYPQGDDRPHKYLNSLNIGLDIDEVLADFIGGYMDRYGGSRPLSWDFDYSFYENLNGLKEDKEFWMNLKSLISPEDLNFEPHCYVTSRNIPTEWTQEWLNKMGFPSRPVYTVGLGESKVEAVKEAGVDIFVDDSYNNFVELNRLGICTYLMDARHNKKYDVGHKRLLSLKDLR